MQKKDYDMRIACITKCMIYHLHENIINIIPLFEEKYYYYIYNI